MKKIKFKVTDTEVIIIEKPAVLSSGNINTILCEFDVSESYNDLLLRACFNGEYVDIVEDMCYMPLVTPGLCEIGVYGYTLDGDNYKKIISPIPTQILITTGSYDSKQDACKIITASEIEQAISLITELVNSGKIKGDKGEPGEQGPQGIQGVQGEKGEKGDKGDPATINGFNVISFPFGSGMTIDSSGKAEIHFPVKELKSANNDIYITHGSQGDYRFEFQSSNYVGISTFSNNIDTINKKLANISTAKQNKLTAGAGIKISENNVISADVQLAFEIVDQLPTVGNSNIIYLVPDDHAVNQEINYYNEWFWVAKDKMYELIGRTDIDLSKYYTKEETKSLIAETQTQIITDTENSTVPAFELANNTEYRFMLELESIEFTLPEQPTDDYISSLVFKSGATATTITYPDTIKWAGDDISSDKFVPASSKTYETLIYWNGINFCGIVKGW